MFIISPARQQWIFYAPPEAQIPRPPLTATALKSHLPSEQQLQLVRSRPGWNRSWGQLGRGGTGPCWEDPAWWVTLRLRGLHCLSTYCWEIAFNFFSIRLFFFNLCGHELCQKVSCGCSLLKSEVFFQISEDSPANLSFEFNTYRLGGHRMKDLVLGQHEGMKWPAGERFSL